MTVTARASFDAHLSAAERRVIVLFWISGANLVTSVLVLAYLLTS